MTRKDNILKIFKKMIGNITKIAIVYYQRLHTEEIISNKIVTINLWNELIKIPINHRLPMYSYLYKNYSTNLLRISNLITTKYETFTAIDVGANIGDSALLIRQGSNAKIYCIEGDGFYLKVLRSNLKNMNNVRIIKCFVGEKNEVVEGELNKIGGTGNLDLHNPHGKTKIQTLDTIINKGDRGNIKLLKIDTDGFDGRVIRGSKEILLFDKPVIYFEFDQHLYNSNGDSTYELLKYLYNKDYNRLLIYDNYGKLIRGFKMNTFVSKKRFNNIFNYKNEDYYDLVAFNKIDDGLYKYSLISETRHFNKKK